MDGVDDTPNDREVEDIRLTFDLSLEADGANFFAAVVYRGADDDASIDVDQYGLVAQGGLFLTDDLELYARYEYGDLDRPGVEDLSVLTVGVNRYWAGHGLKWTTDVGYGFRPIAAEWAASNTGWLADDAGHDGQIVVRSQLQLLF